MEFHVGVPKRVHDAHLETTLLDFSLAAADLAAERLSQSHAPFDSVGHRRAIASVRARLDALEPAEVRRETFRRAEERFARRKWMQGAVSTTYPEPTSGPAMPTIDFTYATEAELDTLFAFEEVADAELHATGLGVVDGNEVGERVFTLFLDPKRGKRAQALSAVATLALDRGLRPDTAPKGRS